MTETPEVDTGFDRRSALKKAAVVAGVVAWTTPVVQALTPGVASAATLTGCGPVITVTLRKTGPICQCAPPGAKRSCCSDISYFADIGVTCGNLCGGAPLESDLGTVLGGKPGCPDDALYPQLEQCNGTFQIQIVGYVICADNIRYEVDGMYTATCVDCVV